MRRRDVIGVAVFAAAFPSLHLHAEQKAKPVIGFLSGRSAEEAASQLAAFRQMLGELGYIEGRNLGIEYRWANGRYDLLPGLADELVRQKVDLIAAFGDSAPPAKRATAMIPIVFHTGGDPVGEGLITTLGRPGGNATGFSFLAVELHAKRVELIMELVPHAKLIALLVNPNFRQTQRQTDEVRQAVAVKGAQLHVLEAGTAAEIDDAYAALAGLHAGAVVVGGDPFFTGRQAQLIALAERIAIPAIYQWPDFAAAGGLIGYGPGLLDSYRQVARYVALILKGSKPADLPVQQPTKFELAINLKTAGRLGLAVPTTLLARADEVIE